MSLGSYPAMGLAQARAAWREARENAAMGRDPGLARRRDKPAVAFASVAEEWLKRDQSKNRSFGEVKRIIDREVMPAWDHRGVDEIDRRDLLDLIDDIADRGAVIMARRVQTHLHRFFKWCVGRGIIEINPVADLPKPGSETRRNRVLSDEELIAVWRGTETLGWPFGTTIRLLLLTGARREEIGQLRWSEINFDRAEINLKGERTKNAEPHNIPLSAPAKEMLARSPRIGSSDYVFTTNGRTPISGWSRAKAQLDLCESIAPWRIHDLRRTVATGMQRVGVGLQVVEAILGHVAGSRAGVVGIYQRHSYDAEKRAALEAWGGHVVELIERCAPGKLLAFGSKR